MSLPILRKRSGNRRTRRFGIDVVEGAFVLVDEHRQVERVVGRRRMDLGIDPLGRLSEPITDLLCLARAASRVPAFFGCFGCLAAAGVNIVFEEVFFVASVTASCVALPFAGTTAGDSKATSAAAVRNRFSRTQHLYLLRLRVAIQN